MKKSKLIFLTLVIALITVVGGCSSGDTKFRNMETKLNDGNKDNGWLQTDKNKLNTNLNNGMTRRNMGLNNDNWDDKSNSRVRNNNNLNNDMISKDNVNNNDNINNMSKTKNLSTRANDIAKRVAALDEVDNASVVINKNTAIVGIETNDKNMIDNNINSKLKQKVEAAVRAGDRNIKTIKITSDSDITSRLKTMTTQLNKGNPISEFTSDIKDILEKIANPKK